MPLPAIAAQGAQMGLGIVQGMYNDARQIRQQSRLNELEKGMMDYSFAKQLEMWKATSYPAQKEMMKEAGLNPAMMYGMSGGGGTTTGHASSNAAHAPAGGGEINQAMGMQFALMDAQRQVLITQADKNKADADKTRGVDTRAAEQGISASAQAVEESKAREELIWQQKFNEQVKNNLLRIEESIQRMAEHRTGETLEESIQTIKYETRILEKQLSLLENQKDISDATKQDEINRIKANAIGAVLSNALTAMNTHKTAQEIKTMINDIMVKWRSLGIHQQEAELKTMIGMTETDPVNTVLKGLTGAINNIIVMGTAGATAPTRTVIEGFKKR